MCLGLACPYMRPSAMGETHIAIQPAKTGAGKGPEISCEASCLARRQCGSRPEAGSPSAYASEFSYASVFSLAAGRVK